MANMFFYSFSFLVVLSSVLAATPFETPDASSDCTNLFTYTSCNAGNLGDRSQCCKAGTTCCAGGCCAANSLCIYGGTSKEACCAISSTDYCGAKVEDIKAPIRCVDAESGAYQCPFGSECIQGGCAGVSSTVRATVGSKSTSKTATADASSTQTASTTSETPTATSTEGSVTTAGSATPSATTTKPAGASKYVAGVFSIMAGVIVAAVFLL